MRARASLALIASLAGALLLIACIRPSIPPGDGGPAEDCAPSEALPHRDTGHTRWDRWPIQLPSGLVAECDVPPWPTEPLCIRGRLSHSAGALSTRCAERLSAALSLSRERRFLPMSAALSAGHDDAVLHYAGTLAYAGPVRATFRLSDAPRTMPARCHGRRLPAVHVHGRWRNVPMSAALPSGHDDAVLHHARALANAGALRQHKLSRPMRRLSGRTGHRRPIGWACATPCSWSPPTSSQPAAPVRRPSASSRHGRRQRPAMLTPHVRSLVRSWTARRRRCVRPARRTSRCPAFCCLRLNGSNPTTK